jgi:hypothetical protein
MRARSRILLRALIVADRMCARGADVWWRRARAYDIPPDEGENDHGPPPEAPCGCVHRNVPSTLSDADDAAH